MTDKAPETADQCGSFHMRVAMDNAVGCRWPETPLGGRGPHLGDTEVPQLDLVLGRQEDVGWFEVPGPWDAAKNEEAARFDALNQVV